MDAGDWIWLVVFVLKIIGLFPCQDRNGVVTSGEHPRDYLEKYDRYHRVYGSEYQEVDLAWRSRRHIVVVPVGNCPVSVMILPPFHWSHSPDIPTYHMPKVPGPPETLSSGRP